MLARAAAASHPRLNLHLWVRNFAIVALNLSAIASASAQVTESVQPWTPSVIPIYQMSRPLYSLPPINIGGFLAAPTASQMMTYDDNIFASDAHKFGDWIGTTTEGLDLEAPWERDSAGIKASLSQQYYADHSTENANSYSVEGIANFELDNDASIGLHAGFAQQPQLRNSEQADGNSVGRPIFNTLSGEADYTQDWGHLGNLVQIQAVQTAYISAAQATRSGVKMSYRDRLSYALTGDSWVFVDGTYSHENWLLNGALRNYNILSGLAGVGAQLTDLVDAEIGVGVLRQQFRFSGFPDLVTPIFSGHLTWNVLPLTSVLISTSKTVTGLEAFCSGALRFGSCTTAPGGSGSNPGNQLGSLELQTSEIELQHEFWHDLLADVRLQYEKQKFSPVNLVDQNYAAIFETRFLVNENWELDLSYSRNIRSANQSITLYNSGPYNANTASLTLRGAL